MTTEATKTTLTTMTTMQRAALRLALVLITLMGGLVSALWLDLPGVVPLGHPEVAGILLCSGAASA